MAKRPRVSKQDRISCLPDDLLGRVISFLPIKEAVRTSVLSKRWGNVFPLISNLDFEDCFTRRKSESVLSMDFVDRVLILRNAGGDVNRLRLKCGEFVKSNRVHTWIKYALKNKVKDIDLWLACKDQSNYMFPIGVFTCQTLVSLKLAVYYNCKFGLKLPVKVHLPRLKILHISGIKFSDQDDTIQTLVSGCSVLEELVLTRCVGPSKFSVCSPTLKKLTISKSWGSDIFRVVIDTPSLVYFRCCYLPHRFLLKNLHSLVEAVIELGTFFKSSESFLTHYEAAKNLFRTISNVQTLRLSGTFGKPIVEDRSIIPEFPQLTYLDLDVNFSVGWETVLPLLLACSPCIEDFVLKVHHCRVELPSVGFPSLSLTQLKTLQILSFKQNDLRMVKHFLKNAQVLENLTLEITAKKWRDLEPWKSKITQKLLNLPKVSKKCKVLVNFL